MATTGSYNVHDSASVILEPFWIFCHKSCPLTFKPQLTLSLYFCSWLFVYLFQAHMTSWCLPQPAWWWGRLSKAEQDCLNWNSLFSRKGDTAVGSRIGWMWHKQRPQVNWQRHRAGVGSLSAWWHTSVLWQIHNNDLFHHNPYFIWWMWQMFFNICALKKTC